MLKYIILLSLFLFASGGYHCRTPTDCSISCSNYSPSQLSNIAGTDWIAVPYDTGSCYFHNTKTREDTGSLPVRNLRIKPLN